MPPIERLAVARGAAEDRVVLEAVVPRLDRDEPWRQRPAHGVGRAVVRAAPAVGARVEVEHVLPGEVLERLHAERLHLRQLLVGHAPLDGLHRALVQLREVDAEEGRLDVELDAEGPVAQQEEEQHVVREEGAEVQASAASAWTPTRGACCSIHGIDSTASRERVRPAGACAAASLASKRLSANIRAAISAEQEDGVDRTALAELRRHVVARGLEDDPADAPPPPCRGTRSVVAYCATIAYTCPTRPDRPGMTKSSATPQR